MLDKPNKILLVGNGFDLAHKLFTRYSDVLDMFKNWKKFYESYKNRNLDNDYIKKIAGNTINSLDSFDTENLEKLDQIIKNNSWIDYYMHCGAEIDLWIDFEREIIPVLNLFDCIFKSEINLSQRSIKVSGYNYMRLEGRFSNYFTIMNDKIFISEEYANPAYGLMKKKILRDLKNEFLEFIEAVEIYFYEFVEKDFRVHKIEQIRNIEPDYIINFNYTHTEKYYGFRNDRVHHIHGFIRDNLKCGSNNMVLGVNGYENKDFIYFVKYFQRIQKHCGVDYKNFVNEPCIFKTEDGVDKEYNDFELYIYGHSLDETDNDILKYVIGDFDEFNEFQLKPRKVTIYYCNQEDFEAKVINLITLYGRDVVEKCMDNNRIVFIKTESNTIEKS